MDETILFPSPNWFQPSGMAVTGDEWVFYGGPTKSLCVLEPLPAAYDTVIKEREGYTAHVVNRAHPEKITTVDVCPDWPEKRCLLTGSSDGAVKQWSLEKVNESSLKIKPTHSHEIHSHEKEEVVGVGYCKDGYAVTVGGFGHIVKWDLNSNVAKSFNHVLKNFKPVTMACSPHVHMHVAIGTKQGVLFVLDLTGSPRTIYKVRVQDEEIVRVSWCPQYEVAVRKALKEYNSAQQRKSTATARLEAIRNEVEAPETLKVLDERVKNSHTTEQPVPINENAEPIPQDDGVSSEVLDKSGVGKTLPEDSFDESVVQEDDTFDIYKDHEADEFGHKKYQPVDVLVKIPAQVVKEDYLAECQKLKEEILERKAQSETSIGELVDAMDKTQLDASPPEQPTVSKPLPHVEGKITKGEVESSVHIHKHLLATIGKQGSVRIWSKSGKLVGSCAVAGAMGGGGGGKGARGARRGGCTTLLWARPDSLLVADGNSHLLECNPLKLDCKNKLEWAVLHQAHSRGLFALGCSAARAVRVGERSPAVAWSAAQDRLLVRYCLDTARLTTYATCGGFVYTVKPCPYDARRVAVSVGDGMVRVWEADQLPGDEARLRTARLLGFWQNVMGKVLVTAWHPHKENLLAFATAESRVGLIDTSKPEKAAQVLQPAFTGGVYSLSWGRADELYASGTGKLALYHTSKPDQAAESITVSLEGAGWEVSAVASGARGLVVGSNAGAVAVLTPQHQCLTAAFVFNKMIHTIEWHPQPATCDGDGDAPPYADLIAVCSLSKANTVVILQYQDSEEEKKLTVWKTLSGHKDTVLQVAWSPHDDHHLLSTSQDGTVRVWDVSTGACTHVFGGHVFSALGAAWLAWPGARAVLSGGGDCCVRLWRLAQHPADQFQATKYEVTVEKKGKKGRRERARAEGEAAAEEGGEAGVEGGDAGGGEQAVPAAELKRRYNKKFLLPMMEKQISSCGAHAPRLALQRRLGAGSSTSPAPPPLPPTPHGHDFLDAFGNINQLNQVLDNEMERHVDTGAWEAWVVLGVVRGTVDGVLQRAASTHALDPFLLSLAPCVSFKYWKDVTLQYLQQIDWLTAKAEENKLIESKAYGGALYRKVAVLLSLHDVRGAVTALLDARLFKEAYVLSRTRYMDSLAEETLRGWAQFCLSNCQYNMSAVCFITLGDLTQAAAALSKSTEEESLGLAADIAKIIGQNTFAGHIEDKLRLINTQKELKHEQDDLEKLPTRAELIAQQVTAKESKEDKDQMDVAAEVTTESQRDTTAEVDPVLQPKVKKEAELTSKESKDIEDKDQMEDTAEGENESQRDTTHIAAKVESVLEPEVKKGIEDEKKVGIKKLESFVQDMEQVNLNAESVPKHRDQSEKDKEPDTKVETESKNVASNVESVAEYKNPSRVQCFKEQEIVEDGPELNKLDITTNELLQQLPQVIDCLLKESVLINAASNGTHKGDGDTTIQNGNVKQEKNNGEVSEKGDLTSID